MGENYLDMVPVIVIFFALGILLSRLGGVGGIVVRIKRMICKLKDIEIEMKKMNKYIDQS